MDRKSFIGIIVVLILFLGIIFWGYSIQNDLKQNGLLLPAKITGINAGGKGSGGFDCELVFNNQLLEMTSPSSLKRGKSYFIGKRFFAMYSPKTKTCELLITPVDFEKFDLPFPDSLHWVMEYVLEH